MAHRFCGAIVRGLGYEEKITGEGANGNFMANVAWLAVFVLGIRHGADPDHLAAIDNLTRRSAQAHPRLSRFTGGLFACGHAAVVVTIASLAGLIGSGFAAYGAIFQSVGNWIGIATLTALAIFTLAQLSSPKPAQPAGLKTRLLPAALRLSRSPLAAIPTGMIFGLGFDTASQIAAYALAFSAGQALAAALAVGVVFSLGMAVVDTFNSYALARLWQRPDQNPAQTTRIWTLYVAILALAIASYEMAQAVGWHSPVPDLAVSVAVICSVVGLLATTVTAGALSKAPHNGQP